MPDYLAFKRVYHSDLLHFGIKHRSGRYPWGSGERPYQSLNQRQIIKSSLKDSRSSLRNDHTIPKGTTVYRTTSSEKYSTEGPTYVTYLEPDRNLYRGGYIRSRDGKNKAYEHQMELKEDLRVPSRETLTNTMETIIKRKPELVREVARGWVDIWMPTIQESLWNEEIGGVDQKKVKSLINDISQNYKDRTIEEMFAMTAESLGTSPRFKAEMIKELKKKGYNAMVDEAGVGTEVVEGIDPLIVFDSDRSLTYKSTSKITDRTESKAKNKYTKWRGNAQRVYNRTGEW